MNRARNTGIIVALLIAVGAVGVALRPTSTETEVLPPVTLPDPTDDLSAAVVIGSRASGGFSLFGLEFGEATYTIAVQFYAPAGCYERLTSGDPWPAPFEECASPVPIGGLVSGGGVAATGESIIAVDVDVDEDCYDAIGRGDDWPPSSAACW